MTLQEIIILQTNLSRLGYLTKADGVFGLETLKNLMAFQLANDLGSINLSGLYGPVTKAKIEMLVNKIKPALGPEIVSTSETPWMDWLRANKGQAEIPGDAANPFIIDLFRFTSLWGDPLSLSDETAWCAALACAALEKNGYTSPRSAAAASFDNYGEPSTLKFGAICTFQRSGGSGRHVTFYDSTIDDGRMWCLGGNQNNALTMELFSQTQLVATRWPIKMTSTTQNSNTPKEVK